MDLNISVLNTDYGLGIITKKDNPNNKYQIGNDLNYYSNLTYCDLAANRKEMLNLILEGQQDINKRIDELHEKVNQKISRQELSGWLVAISALVVLINNLM